jgi:hypothetical protein
MKLLFINDQQMSFQQDKHNAINSGNDKPKNINSVITNFTGRHLFKTTQHKNNVSDSAIHVERETETSNPTQNNISDSATQVEKRKKIPTPLRTTSATGQPK